MYSWLTSIYGCPPRTVPQTWNISITQAGSSATPPVSPLFEIQHQRFVLLVCGLPINKIRQQVLLYLASWAQYKVFEIRPHCAYHP